MCIHVFQMVCEGNVSRKCVWVCWLPLLAQLSPMISRQDEVAVNGGLPTLRAATTTDRDPTNGITKQSCSGAWSCICTPKHRWAITDFQIHTNIALMWPIELINTLSSNTQAKLLKNISQMKYLQSKVDEITIFILLSVGSMFSFCLVRIGQLSSWVNTYAHTRTRTHTHTYHFRPFLSVSTTILTYLEDEVSYWLNDRDGVCLNYTLHKLM